MFSKYHACSVTPHVVDTICSVSIVLAAVTSHAVDKVCSVPCLLKWRQTLCHMFAHKHIHAILPPKAIQQTKHKKHQTCCSPPPPPPQLSPPPPPPPTPLKRGRKTQKGSKSESISVTKGQSSNPVVMGKGTTQIKEHKCPQAGFGRKRGKKKKKRRLKKKKKKIRARKDEKREKKR